MSLDPELRERLFDGEINLFQCDECGFEAYLPKSLLYHEMKRKFFVHYHPPAFLKSKEFYGQYDIRGKIPVDTVPEFVRKMGRYMREPHIVFDINEMINYIIFREVLYDQYGENSL